MPYDVTRRQLPVFLIILAFLGVVTEILFPALLSTDPHPAFSRVNIKSVMRHKR